MATKKVSPKVDKNLLISTKTKVSSIILEDDRIGKIQIDINLNPDDNYNDKYDGDNSSISSKFHPLNDMCNDGWESLIDMKEEDFAHMITAIDAIRLKIREGI